MPQAKAQPKAAPTPKAAPKKATPAPKAAPKKAAHSSDKVQVRNTTKSRINLANGSIEPGKKGVATVAEMSVHAKRLERA